jgi:hypothetical protein
MFSRDIDSISGQAGLRAFRSNRHALLSPRHFRQKFVVGMPLPRKRVARLVARRHLCYRASDASAPAHFNFGRRRNTLHPVYRSYARQSVEDW